MRRYLTILAILTFAGCGSSASTGKAMSTTSPSRTTTKPAATTTQPATSVAPVTTKKPAPTTTLMHGQPLVDLIKSESMSNDPMLMPLADAQWEGGYLVLTYQLDDKSIAASLCSFVSSQAPPGWTLEQFSKVQVVGPGGTLAMTNLSGPGCHEGAF